MLQRICRVHICGDIPRDVAVASDRIMMRVSMLFIFYIVNIIE
jgi:hypothetical protein